MELKDDDDDDDEGDDAEEGQAIRATQLTATDTAEVEILQPRDVDAFWLQRQLNTRMKEEAEVIQKRTERVLEILGR